MEGTPNLYNTLIDILGQPSHWRDIRHLHTLAWMIVGLLHSKVITLPEWTPYVDSRATYAQSTVRRFRRWLDNEHIRVHELYGPIIRDALKEWDGHTLYVALDTSLLWDHFCIIRLSVIFRGRSVPLVWTVIVHNSSAVAFDTYRDLLDRGSTLLPSSCRVVFLADRGFADTKLMAYLSQTLHWHWRIRIKASFYVYRKYHRRMKISTIKLKRGQARFWHNVYITANQFGPVHLALAKPHGVKEEWLIVSDEPTAVTTFDEYGLRFDIEEGFLDDKSGGFQLESSQIRSAEALERLCFVLAVATLFLVSQGIEVVETNKRRLVDVHWFRGNSYLKIGWKWVQHALIKGYSLLTRLALSPFPDPEPAMASRKQAEKRASLAFSVQFEVFTPYIDHPA